MSLCTNSAFGKVRKFPNFQSAKGVKKLKSKKLPSSFLGLNFLHLPNVLIHEPNEFIHVRKLKPTLKIQIHYFLVQKSFLFVLSVTRTRLITSSNLVPFWLELCYSDLV